MREDESDGSPRILVVEDDRALGRVLELALSAGGWSVELAENGQRGLSQLAAGEPDAVVLDVGPPDIDGIALRRRLRRAGNRVPVLMVSARDGVEHRIDGLDAGADDYLCEPFDVGELRARRAAGDPHRPRRGARAARAVGSCGMERYACVACGTQFAEREEPPPECPVCLDPRQFVPPEGQRWTTLAELASDHENAIRPEGELVGIGTEPAFAIGQRALLVPFGDSNLLWDCVTLLDDATAADVERRGGLRAIAISHPHYYSAMVEWAHRFDCPIHLHAADAEWVMRPDEAIAPWDGETLALGGGLTLIRGGGHFPGGTILHRDAGAGALLTGDIIQVVPDRSHVAFMWSYPNLVPLPETEVDRIAAAVEPYRYAAIYGAWWGTVIERDGPAIVRRSAARYRRALRGELL